MVPNNQRKRAPKNRRRRPARPERTGLRSRVLALLGAGAAAGALLWLGDGFDVQSAATATLLAEAPEFVESAPTSSPEASANSHDTDRIEGELGAGETLSQALRDRGLDTPHIQEIIEALRHEFDFRFSRAGDSFTLLTARGTGDLLSFEYRRGPLEVYAITRDDQGRLLSFQKATTSHGEQRNYTLRVTESLREALPEGLEGAQLAESLWEVFGAEIDLHSIPAGSKIVLRQESTEGRARVTAARVTLSDGTTRQAFYYIDPEGRGAYVDETGRYLGSAYLQSPFKFTDLAGEAPHLGDDPATYTATAGTPLVAVGDGVVRFAGTRGIEGTVVELALSDGGRALYRGIQKIAPGIKEGVLVNQGRALGTSSNTIYFAVLREKKTFSLKKLSTPEQGTIPVRHRAHFEMFLREQQSSLASTD